MNYKILRTLLVLIGIAGLAGFAYTFYDFVQHRNQRMATLDLTKLIATFRPPIKGVDDHKDNWQSGTYDVIWKLDVFDNRPKVTGTGVDGPPTPPPPVISDKDLVLACIQFVEGAPAACRAYIYPRGVQAQEGKILGDFYAVGDVVKVQLTGKPEVKLTLDAIRAEEVDLSIVGKENSAFTLRRKVFELPNMDKIQLADGSTTLTVKQPAPEQTRMMSQDYWVVGTKDLESMRGMSEDEMIASLPSKPAYDENHRARGQRLGRISKDSPFADRGLQEGDIVLSVNGYPAKDRADLVKYLREQTAVDTFVVEIERAGGVRQLTYRVPR